MLQSFRTVLRAGALAGAVAFTLASPAGALTIDSFDGASQLGGVLGGPIGPKTDGPTVQVAPEALGGSRVIQIDRTSANGGGVLVDVNLSFLPGLGFSTSPNTTGTALLLYTPAAPVDLTEGGTQTGIRVDATSDLGAELIIQLITTTGTLTGSATVAADPTYAFQSLVIDYASLVGTGDLTQVGQIAFVINGNSNPGTDVGVRFLGTIPEPGTALLLAGGLSGLALAGRRRRA